MPKKKPLTKEDLKKLKTRAKKPPVKYKGEKPRQKRIPDMAWLRHFAATLYVTSLDGLTINDLYTDPRFTGLKKETLQYWCHVDNWVDQRNVYFTKIREEIEKKVGDKLVQERIKTLHTVSSMVNKGIEGLERNMGKVRSYDTLMMAVLKAMEFREGLLDKIMVAVDPKQIEQEGGRPIRQSAQLSKEELVKMTQTVLELRRTEQRKAKAAAKVNEGEEETTPQLRIVRKPVK